MSRKFQISDRLNSLAKGSILDIPHTAILKYKTPDEIVKTFKAQWGVEPEAVVLPVTNPDGLLFPVDGLSDGSSFYATMGEHDFRSVASYFADRGINIYLSIDPVLSFLNTDPLQLIDITGNSTRQLCVGNKRTKQIVAAILGTGVDIVSEAASGKRGNLLGVVLDLVNLWPMGGDNDRLKLTCFCPSCEAYFEKLKPGLVKKFKTFPNPWNLLLEASSTGIDHINEIRKNATQADIVGLSRQKGFIKAFGESSVRDLNLHAQDALDYIKVRHNQTVAAANDIFNDALNGLDSPPRRILLIEGMYYSWTAGLQFERLDEQENRESFDEVWFDVRSSSLELEKVEYRGYMCSRTRYFVDAFFHLAAQVTNAEVRASTGIGRYTPSQLKEMLNERLAKAMACMMNGKTALGALPDLKETPPSDKDSKPTNPQRLGFVGVGLDMEIGRKFIEELKIAPGLVQSSEENAMATLLQRLAAAQKAQGG